jgi:murein DD-endopeptidase MepM/ murein hydrolase activator NlpD
MAAAGLFAFASVLGGSTAATADEQQDVQGQLNDASDALEDANAAVAEAAAALAEAEKLLPPAQQKLDEATAKENAAKNAFAEATAAYEAATAEFGAAEARLAQIEAQYEDLRSNVGDFARRAYQMGPFAEMEMVLDAADPTEFTDRLAAIRAVSKANNSALGDMAANRADQSYTQMRMKALQELAEEQKAIAEQKLKEAEAARLEAEAAKAQIDLLVAQRDAALLVAEAQRGAVQGQYAALQAEQARIAAQAQAAADALRQGGGNWSSADGFTWPIPGGGVAQFAGPRIHPVYGYRSCHTGIDVRGGSGTPILAVQSGVVASIDNGGPYGLHTLIAHGDGVASMYAHQSATNVSVGQQVKAGDVIGYVGSTGWVTGPHLHFEIHVNGVPYNPMGWFGAEKTPVVC